MHDSEFFHDANGNLHGYGVSFPDGTDELSAHLWLYKHSEAPEGTGVGERGTRWHHFKWCADLLWNYSNSPRKVVWNPWTDKMIKAMIYNDYVGLAGCGSSGKSDSAAVFAIIEYLSYPMGTLVLITSTTIKDAQKRVWKSVAQLWNSLDSPPGYMIQSKAMIAGIDKSGVKSVSTGLQIVAAQKGQDENKMEMAGQKAECLILVADELPELTMGVLRTAYANLSVGSTGIIRPDGTTRETPFKMIAMGNPSTYTDPFGQFCEPVDGWKSVTEADWEWQTSRGICLRFDASQSPNIKANKRIYSWMPTQDIIDKAKNDFGENSRIFYRMYKGFWFADSDMETIYNESEIVQAGAHRPYEGKDVVYESGFAGADPAFSAGGDRFPIVYGRVLDRGSKPSVIQIDGIHLLKEDVTDSTTPRSHCMVRQMRDFCHRKNIPPSHLGYDITGAGAPFRDVVISEWSSLPYGINFGGKASDLAVNPTDQRKSSEVYANRVSELWVRAKGMIREGLIYGLSPDIVEELVQRRWHAQATKLLKVESKVDMKKRTGQSPDLCFVSGTMISTPSGEVPIENLCVGDEVVTPYGVVKVLRNQPHFSEVVERSVNGSTLVGTPDHKVFTYDKGWVPLHLIGVDSLVCSVEELHIWKKLSKSHTRVLNTPFKQVVNTIHAGKKLEVQDFFIESSTPIISAPSKKVTVSTTSTETGETTISQTLNQCPPVSTLACTLRNVGRRIQSSVIRFSLACLNYMKNIRSGVKPKKLSLYLSQTLSRCVNLLGLRPLNLPVKSAEKTTPSMALPKDKDSVEFHAEIKPGEGGDLSLEFAPVAVSRKWSTDTRKPLNASRAQQKPTQSKQGQQKETRKVWTLSVSDENVYFANGVLVANCDALMCMLEAIVYSGVVSQVETKNLEMRSSPVWDKNMAMHDIEGDSDIDLDFGEWG